MSEERFTIIANNAGDKTIRNFAKCWVLFRNPGNGSDRIEVLALNIPGRMIKKFVKLEHLDEFRARWCPDHVAERMTSDLLTKDRATEIAEWYNRMVTENLKKGMTG